MLSRHSIPHSILEQSDFAAELTNLKSADIHLQQSIQFYSQFNEFCKDVSDLEREYAKKMEAIIHKYQSKFEKTVIKRVVDDAIPLQRCYNADLSTANSCNMTIHSNSNMEFSFASTTSSNPLIIKNESNNKNENNEAGDLHDTVMKTWQALLMQFKKLSTRHAHFSIYLSATMLQLIKKEASSKEESRKRHLSFLQTLLKDRNQIYDAKEKAKSKFDQISDTVNESKIKHDKTMDDKLKEKLKRQWHQDILDMNNAKNQYLLALKTANTLKHKYYTRDIPETLKDMHHLGGEITTSMQHLFGLVIDQQKLLRTLCLEDIQPVKRQIDLMDGTSDVLLHLGAPNESDFAACEPFDFEFVPTGLWKEKGDIVQDDHALIFLQNVLISLKKSTVKINEDVLQKDRMIEGMKTLEEAYTFDPSLGDAHEIKEKILDTKREKIRAESIQKKIQTEIEEIIRVCGDLPSNIREHSFKNSSFAIPTTCDYCLQTVWGMGKQGIICQDCGYQAHGRCELKIPATCLKKHQKKTERKSSLQKMISSPIVNNTAASPVVVFKDEKESTIITMTTPAHPEKDQNVSNHVDLTTFATVLFDYIPELSSMEEIQVHQGDVVKLLESDDGSGWTKIEHKGRKGLVPTTYIQLGSLDVVANLEQPSIQPINKILSSSTLISSSSNEEVQQPRNRFGFVDKNNIEMLNALDSAERLLKMAVSDLPSSSTTSLKNAHVLYDYEKSNSEELSVQSGIQVMIVQEDDGSGWTMVSDGQDTGLVPSTYLAF